MCLDSNSVELAKAISWPAALVLAVISLSFFLWKGLSWAIRKERGRGEGLRKARQAASIKEARVRVLRAELEAAEIKARLKRLEVEPAR
jgi:hypothetical protein